MAAVSKKARGSYKDLQTIFDRVAAHLLTQKKKSMTAGSPDGVCDPICAYRGTDDLKCAIGVLIPDNKYRGSFEGNALDYSSVNSSLARAAGIRTEAQRTLAVDLQTIHDEEPVRKWSGSLREVAGRYNLDDSILNKRV
jgi:hypothetical protein